MTEIRNARIIRTMLGLEDHNIMTFWLHLEGDGWGQGYGGYGLGGDFMRKAIEGVLKTVGVREWEQLTGKYVRVEKEDSWGPILRLGHVVEEKWLSLPELAAGTPYNDP